MMRKNRYEKKLSKKLKGEIALLVLGVVLLAGILTYTQMQWKKGKEKGRETEEVTEEVTEDVAADTETETYVPMESEEGTEDATEAKESVTITNLSDYVSPFETEIFLQMESSLTNFAKQEQITADAAEVFHVMIPESDPESVSYYVSVNSEPETICLLSYHRREGVVTASAVSYTKEEIQAEVFEDNGPAERDVPEEADAPIAEPSDTEMTAEVQGGAE